MDVFAHVDPRLAEVLRSEYQRRVAQPIEPLPNGVTVVLAGHRAAGKTRLLPHVARMLLREAVDLDVEVERRGGRSLRDWVRDDEVGFRAAEREVFKALPRGTVTAVGGGFLAHHADALRGCLTVLVPVTFETYVERLRADSTRPRLRPGVPLDVELREVYFEREELHRAARPMGLVEFLLRARRGRRPRRVVTLPPGADPWNFAWAARHHGADLLEVRTDLTPSDEDLRSAARALPLLVSQRTDVVPGAWLELAELVDRPIGEVPAPLVSLHAPQPMRPAEAIAAWRGVARGTFAKHIEPLGPLDDVDRLFETRRALAELFGPNHVTVLPTGPLATPFRAVLARENAFDYLALDETWAGAPGQRLVADAAREWRCPRHDGTTDRLALLGHGVAHSRSPRIHEQPFDRLELPEDVKLKPLLAALRPYYRGFAVTSPFKQQAAEVVGAKRSAVNTLVRSGSGYVGHNSDVEGALKVLKALGAEAVTVLGDGGTTDAIREAAKLMSMALDVRTRASDFSGAVTGAVVWTWPTSVEPPEALRFHQARVAVIAYGRGARRVKDAVQARGGVALALGPRWFIAQARQQRRLW